MIKSVVHKVMTFVFTGIARLRAGSIGSGSMVNYPCKFSKNTFIGNDSHFNGLEVYGSGKVSIGDHFHSGKRCVIMTSNHNYRSEVSLPYVSTWITKDVVIEDNVWLGMGVTILPGVSIGEGAIIQAGSVVVKDIPACAIAGGHPAVVFSWRDKELYRRLREEQLA